MRPVVVVRSADGVVDHEIGGGDLPLPHLGGRLRLRVLVERHRHASERVVTDVAGDAAVAATGLDRLPVEGAYGRPVGPCRAGQQAPAADHARGRILDPDPPIAQGRRSIVAARS